MQIRTLDHFTLYTKDTDACIKFYKMLGFQVRDAHGRYELTSGECLIYVYSLTDKQIIKPKNAQAGCTEIALELSGGLAMLQKYLRQQGLPVVREIFPHSARKGSMNSFVLRDPDGNLVEIISYQG